MISGREAIGMMKIRSHVHEYHYPLHAQPCTFGLLKEQSFALYVLKYLFQWPMAGGNKLAKTLYRLIKIQSSNFTWLLSISPS